MNQELPRLLTDFKPVPGLIKAEPADFRVEEIPLYPFDDSGTHVLFLIEKVGLSTPQAVNVVAQALNVRRRAVGFAGLKDARAVTRQWFSLEHVDPAVIAALDLPRIRVLQVTRHGNKLRIGHLRGNQFTIRVRQTAPERLAELQDALAILSRRGVPNYFGPQRFGQRGDTWQIGRALVRQEPEDALDHVLGRPSEADSPRIRTARQLYDRGEHAAAARLWPGLCRDERRALRALVQSGGRKRRALRAIDPRTRAFYVDAYQSWLFNQVVAARLPQGLDRIWTGDLAWLHANGAVFRVEQPEAEQPRADAFEISPTGPLFGHRMSEPAGPAGELERRVLTAEQLSAETFRGPHLRLKGARRSLRFPAGAPQIRLGADERGAYLELVFSLPRGCYATTLLRELFAAPAAGEATGTEE